MSTQPIEQTVQGYTYKKPKRAQDDAEFLLGPEQSKKRQENTVETRGDVRNYIRGLLSQVESGDDGRLSFRDVVDHHALIQSSWNNAVKNELGQLGVDTLSPFRLMYDPAGAVTVVGDYGDREMIDRYFSTNPGRVREMGDIIQFGRLASTAESRLSVQDMDQTLQTEAMAWWYSSNMDTTTLFAGGGTVFGAGNTPYKGLDILV
nr:hypothetical protein [uncultured Pseudodesulfovibrio sp.]